MNGEVTELIIVKSSEAQCGDVLCGRGNGVLNHPRNMVYMVGLIKKYQGIYQNNQLNNKEKKLIVQKVMDAVESTCPG